MSKTDNPPHHPDDRLFKALFKQPAHVREILESCLPKKLLAVLNLETLRISDTSFVDPQLAEDFADVVPHTPDP
jgi:predicted transposase YdaD